MKTYLLEPEVAGRWGDGTVADTAVHPPIVERLEYVFDGWEGDDLLTSFPCYIVTERLGTALWKADLTGFVLDAVAVRRSERFQELHPDVELPRFLWLRVSGEPGKDDFALATDHRLAVSEQALAVLRRHALSDCLIEEYHA
jgi:hypothetical protein